MFAYCGNDPVSCEDPTGQLTSGEIHNYAVRFFTAQWDTVTSQDTCIYYNGKDWTGGWGFCDLYDTVTGEVWEVKRESTARTCSSKYAKNQLTKYTSGRLKANLALELSEGGQRFRSGTIVVEDWTGEYIIDCWQAEDGILRYNYTYIESEGHKFAIAAGAVAGVCAATAAVVAIVYATKGAAAPMIIKFVEEVIEKAA